MEFTLDEALAIINNPENRYHRAFYENSNAEVVAAVNRAFERAYPGELDLTTNLNGFDPNERGQ